MKYRVVFSELSDEAGKKADDPATSLDAELEPDVVLDARLVAASVPDAQLFFGCAARRFEPFEPADELGVS